MSQVAGGPIHATCDMRPDVGLYVEKVLDAWYAGYHYTSSAEESVMLFGFASCGAGMGNPDA